MNLISGRSMACEQKALGSRSVRRGLLGTTLIEVLVTIVVFLVGILAIAQIFPGGVKILNRTRNTSMAVAMAKSQLEMMAAKPELVPEQILPLEIVNVGGVYTPVENPMHACKKSWPEGWRENVSLKICVKEIEYLNIDSGISKRWYSHTNVPESHSQSRQISHSLA